MGVVSVLPPRRYDAAAVVAVLYNYCLFVFGRTEGNIPTERIGHAQEGRKEGGVLAVLVPSSIYKGASIKYVRAKGEGGCRPKCGRSTKAQ